MVTFEMVTKGTGGRFERVLPMRALPGRWTRILHAIVYFTRIRYKERLVWPVIKEKNHEPAYKALLWFVFRVWSVPRGEEMRYIQRSSTPTS